MKHRVLLVVLVLVSLIGCAVRVQAPRMLPVDTSVSINYQRPQVAIDGQGIRHYAWETCDATGRCEIGYARMNLDRKLLGWNFVPVAGQTFVLADITAETDGTAHIVWQERSLTVPRGGGGTAKDQLVTIPVTPSITPHPVYLTDVGRDASRMLPFLVTYQNTTYAVFNQLNQTSGSDILYRTLDEQFTLVRIIQAAPNKAIIGARGVMDSDGWMYLAYERVETDESHQAIVYHKVKPAETSISANVVTSTDLEDRFGMPDIALGSGGNIYIVFETKQIDGDFVIIYKRTPSDITSWLTVLESTPSTILEVIDEPRIAMIANTIHVVAAAGPRDSGMVGLHLYRNPQNAAPTLEYISPLDSIQERTPELVSQGFFVAAAWRTVGAAPHEATTVEAQAGFPCANQVFSWDNASNRMRSYEIPEHNGCYWGIDLAQGGGLFAATWEHARSDNPDLIGPWTSYTSEASLIPLVRR